MIDNLHGDCMADNPEWIRFQVLREKRKNIVVLIREAILTFVCYLATGETE